MRLLLWWPPNASFCSYIPFQLFFYFRLVRFCFPFFSVLRSASCVAWRIIFSMKNYYVHATIKSWYQPYECNHLSMFNVLWKDTVSVCVLLCTPWPNNHNIIIIIIHFIPFHSLRPLCKFSFGLTNTQSSSGFSLFSFVEIQPETYWIFLLMVDDGSFSLRSNWMIYVEKER